MPGQRRRAPHSSCRLFGAHRPRLDLPPDAKLSAALHVPRLSRSLIRPASPAASDTAACVPLAPGHRCRRHAADRGRPTRRRAALYLEFSARSGAAFRRHRHRRHGRLSCCATRCGAACRPVEHDRLPVGNHRLAVPRRPHPALRRTLAARQRPGRPRTLH